MTACHALTKEGENHYAVAQFSKTIVDKYTIVDDAGPPKVTDKRHLAIKLKNTSDIACTKFKIDLALSQTGDNFLADVTNSLLGLTGAIAGGGVARGTSAAVSAVTGIKGAISSDIFGNITEVVSNYIDTARDQKWIAIQNKFKIDAYSSDDEVFNDLQAYNSRCSLMQALVTAAKESGNKKADADRGVALSGRTDKPVSTTNFKIIKKIPAIGDLD